MALETTLIAITWMAGKYEVVSQISAKIDVKTLEQDGLLHDVSNGVYVDNAAVVQKDHMIRYVSPELHKSAASWLAALPADVMFVLIHEAEWEPRRPPKLLHLWPPQTPPPDRT